MFEKTKKFCDSFIEMGIPGFDLLICKDGKPLLRYSNGYSNAEEKRPSGGMSATGSIPAPSPLPW